MGIVWNVLRVTIVAITVVVVAELSKRYPPGTGALLLSLPIVDLITLLLSWFQHRDLPAISRLAQEDIDPGAAWSAIFRTIRVCNAIRFGFLVLFLHGIILASITTGQWMLLAGS